MKAYFYGGEEDEIGLAYIKDLARAIALLWTQEKLTYNVYNVGSEKKIPNRDLVETIKRVVPNFNVDLPPGRSPFPPVPRMLIGRLREDTGYTPKFDLESAVRDYVEWLRAGNSK